MSMRNLAAVVLSVGTLTLAAVSACGDSDPIVPQNDVFSAPQMTNAKEVPPVTGKTSSGTGLITINAARTSVAFTFTTVGLDSVISGHIHCCAAAGVNASVVIGLLSFPAPGVQQATFTGTITGAALTTALSSAAAVAALGTAAPLDSLVKAILRGNAYVNLHTVTSPGGEIRAQLQ
jgi:hypothetical protein